MRSTDDKAARGGFTLVEILITIAIVGILVVIAVGNFGGLNEKYKVEAETKQLYADLMDARGRAMQRNRMFFVRISATGYATYEDTNTPPDGNGVWDGAADTRLANVTGTHTITTAGGANAFEFNRNGIASVTLGISGSRRPHYPTTTASGSGRRESRWGSTSGGSALKNNGGMTLIEVLVAMAIVFIVFLGMSSAGLVVLDQNIKNSQRDEAVGVAEMEMQQVRNTPFATIANDNHIVYRQIRGLNVGYTVARTVADPNGATPATDPNNRRVTISVTWDRIVNNQTKTYNHTVITIVRPR